MRIALFPPVSSVTELKMLGYLISKGQIKPDPDRMQPLLDLLLPCDKVSLKIFLGLFSYHSQWVPQYSDKICPLTNSSNFPLDQNAVQAFQMIKKCVADACVVIPNNSDLLVLELNASGYALSDVAFFSRTLNTYEKRHSYIEQESCTIVEACRKWRHFLNRRKFTLVTDREAVSYLFNKSTCRSTARNGKMMRWRVELSCLKFDIKFRPGKDNQSADCLQSLLCCSISR